jgi:stage V sporulation protein AC
MSKSPTRKKERIFNSAPFKTYYQWLKDRSPPGDNLFSSRCGPAFQFYNRSLGESKQEGDNWVMAAEKGLQEQIQQETKAYQEKKYQALVEQIKPKPDLRRNMLGAFLVGGLICLIGQIFVSFFLGRGLSQEDAFSATAAVMIFFGALLTGLGIYDNIAKFAGAGSIVPITGFANSIVSPALEFKKEGFVFGLASKLFVIAGPVLAYGFIISVLIGLLYYLLQ